MFEVQMILTAPPINPQTSISAPPTLARGEQPDSRKAGGVSLLVFPNNPIYKQRLTIFDF